MTYWVHRQSDGENPVASRSHAAVVYLIEQHSFATVLQLLTNNPGSIVQFHSGLAQLTGVDRAALDQAVGAWIGGVKPLQASGNGVSLALTVSPASSFGDATVTFTQPLTCGSLTLAIGTKLTFTLDLASPPSFNGPGNYQNGSQRTLANGGANGALEYADARAACDTGPLAFN
jgi:hypothetical protein